MINAIVAIGQTDWEAQFVSGLTHPMTGIQVQRRCVDAVDVLAVIKVLSCDAVIISDHTLRLDAEFIAEVQNQNIRIIALTEKVQFFEQLGVKEIVLLDPTNPLATIPLISALVKVNKIAPDVEAAPTGELIFVGGFGGGTGKTRLAAELSFQLATQGDRTLLIDGDTYGPVMFQLFGLAPTGIGLLEMCRKLERNTAEEKFLTASTTSIFPNLDLVGGISKSSRWIDLRLGVVNDFWQLSRAEYKNIVIDGGPITEVEPLMAIEIGIPKRNLVANSALQASQKVILTCRAQSLSVTKLIRGLAENPSLFTNKELTIAVLGSSTKKQTKDSLYAIASHTDCDNLLVIENDEVLVEKALGQNNLVSALAPKSHLTHSYAELAKAIFNSNNFTGTSGRFDRMFAKRHALNGVS